MNLKKVSLTIFLILVLVVFIPKNINAATAFRCFYSVTNDETKEQYTLKLLYANGTVKAAKYKTPHKEFDIDPWASGLSNWANGENYKSWFKQIGIWDSMEKLSGEQCPDEFRTANGLITATARQGDTNNIALAPYTNGKSYTYRLTGGTQVIGNPKEKECEYVNASEKTDIVKVRFDAVDYMNSSISSNSKEMTGFWWSANKMFYGLREWKTSGDVKEMGIYDSYYKYLTTYTTQESVCPAKIFVNPQTKKWYAASDSISDKQNERNKDQLADFDEQYQVYKLDKDKICRDNKSTNEALLSEIEQRVNSLESGISNVGTEFSGAIVQNFTNIYEEIQQKITQLASNINHCSDSPGYKDIQDRLNEVSKKMQELRQTLKSNVRGSNLSDEEKEGVLKAIDSAYSKLLKSENLDISNYNQAMDCTGLFGDPNDTESVAYLIQKILDYIKIIGPILVVVLSTVDFIKVIWVSDAENMKKAQQKLVKRLAAAILLFLLPLLVGLLFSLLNNSIVDPTCGIQ